MVMVSITQGKKITSDKQEAEPVNRSDVWTVPQTPFSFYYVAKMVSRLTEIPFPTGSYWRPSILFIYNFF